MSNDVTVKLPVGRFVQGSLYVGQKTNSEGQPIIIKSGANQGQPGERYFFAIAIAKKPGETHWGQTEWGAKIWAFGHTQWPGGQASSPVFAWKIKDGDDAAVKIDSKGGTARKNCEREGFAGHWIVKCTSHYAPKICDRYGKNYIADVDAVRPGDFIEVVIALVNNKSQLKPGIFLNPAVVAFTAYGTPISFSPGLESYGLGATVLPAGASLTPVGSMGAPSNTFTPSPAAPGNTFTPPALPGNVYDNLAQPPQVPNNLTQPSAQVLPQGVTPYPQILQAGQMPVPPASNGGYRLTQLANGMSYEQLIAAGWNHQLLLEKGLISAQ